ncbi:hypothetical protein JHK85_022068 [Glycine max]|nr:hypothetical protein JHK85_022068 [Glycine max]
MGYPSKDGPAAVGYTQQRLPEETKTRGDGFWEGCAPPPMGYPSKDDPTAVGYPQQRVPEETTSRGDGFWKGCSKEMNRCIVDGLAQHS